QAEGELGGLAEDVEQLLRIPETRHLHQDAVVALALDRRLDQTELVDALADDLDRLIEHLPRALEKRRLGDGQTNDAAADVLDVERALAGGADEAAERLRQLAQLGEPLLQVVLADHDLYRVAADHRGARETDAGLAQDLAHVVLQRQQLLPAHVVDIDLEQDVRAALQVEAEHDSALRPLRPALDRALGEEIRNREQAADQCREQDRRRLPSGDMEHGSSRLAPRLLLGRRSARLVLDLLALGANARLHRAHLAHSHAVRDFHLDLVVVDDLGDLAHQPAGGNDSIAAAQVLDQLLVLLGPLLLRPQDQEIHDHEDQHERQQLHQHIIATERARLGKSGRHEHRSGPCMLGNGAPSRRRRGLPRAAKSARTIAGSGPIATWPGLVIRPDPDASAAI